MRHCGKSDKAAEIKVRTMAPVTDPVMDPRPPRTTMVRMSKDRMKVKDAGWAMKK